MRSRLVVPALLVFACRDTGSEPATQDDDAAVPFMSATAGDDGDTDTAMVIVPGEATDLCGLASSIDGGFHRGTLRGRQSDLGGACGLGGPDAFFRLDVSARVDVWVAAQGVAFTPRVGILPGGCANVWDRQTLLCTESIGAWLLDVAAGSSLAVSVGIDADHPALEIPPPGDDEPDALEFRLEVKMRNVLDAGQACEPPGRGRCAAGTACLSAADGPAVCTILAADTCATAQPVVLALGTTSIAIPRDAIHSDAHRHSCGGARHPDRVLALSLPAGSDPLQLAIETDAPEVGLALREIDCDPEREIDCDPGSDAGARLAVDVADARPLLLFVELAPEPTGEEAPIVLFVELTAPR